MFTRWRNAAVVVGAFCFPYAFAAGSSNDDTIPAAKIVRVVQAGTPGLAGWDGFLPHRSRAFPGSNCSAESITEIDGESLPEMPPVRVPSAPWVYLEEPDEDTLVIDSRGLCNDPTCPCHETPDIDRPSQPARPDQNRQSERLDESPTKILFSGSIEILDEEPAGATQGTSSAGDCRASERLDADAELCPVETEDPESGDPEFASPEEDGTIEGIFTPFEVPIDWARREALWI